MPVRTCPEVLVGKPAGSPNPFVLAHGHPMLQECHMGSLPHPVGSRTRRQRWAEKPAQTSNINFHGRIHKFGGVNLVYTLEEVCFPNFTLIQSHVKENGNKRPRGHFFCLVTCWLKEYLYCLNFAVQISWNI